MTNTAIRRTTGARVAALFVAVGAATSIAPAYADPAYDQTDAIRTAKQFCLDISRQGFDVEGRIHAHDRAGLAGRTAARHRPNAWG